MCDLVVVLRLFGVVGVLVVCCYCCCFVFSYNLDLVITRCLFCVCVLLLCCFVVLLCDVFCGFVGLGLFIVVFCGYVLCVVMCWFL